MILNKGMSEKETTTKDKDHGVIGSDNIDKASNEDMYAFSQIVVTGGKVLQTVNEIEKEAKAEKERKANKVKSWQVAAEAEKKLGNKEFRNKRLNKKQKAEHEKAIRELKALQSNEATSAFAKLQEAQEIEVMAEQALGSGQSAEELKK